MKIYKLEREQTINIPVEISWSFFSNPKNLQEITPKNLSFNILSELPKKVYPGLIILYKLKILGIFQTNWVTEITQVKDNEFFIDEQRFGPYKFWHHQHIFINEAGKTRMKDIVHFGLPFGIFGRIGIGFVNNQLEEIFSYRKKKLDDSDFITKIIKETKL